MVSFSSLFSFPGGSSAQPAPTQPCNCKKSKCLKLYCECFASGNYCSDCNCNNCSNNKESEPQRREAVQSTLERNPNAFKPKVKPDDADAKHSKGCHCKKSQCLKKYCECFQADIICSDICKCINCQNFEGSSLLKEIHLSKPRNRTSPTLKRPRVNNQVASSSSSAVGPSMLVAAAMVKAEDARHQAYRQQHQHQDIASTNSAMMAALLGGGSSVKSKQQQQYHHSNSKQLVALEPALLLPGSPASEVTSEWTPLNSSAQSEQGTTPFGKACPKLKQNVIFQVGFFRFFN